MPSRAALHASDCDPAGFAWIDLHNADQSVFAFLRRDPQAAGLPPLVCAFNCTPVPRDGYWIGVPEPGIYRKILDSDAPRFGGSGYSRQDQSEAEPVASHGYPCRLRIDLPPLGAVFFEPERET